MDDTGVGGWQGFADGVQDLSTFTWGNDASNGLRICMTDEADDGNDCDGILSVVDE